ncbi:uncharacterized protein E0L32_007033 [Thyridium curvatum]|uniref:Glycosyltransferase 61 catalytic domain-containing protein n=1 Tax=Thyridium curvatum TaxID=1093900 RepID=A0A507AXC3_9PEZI|nr:uncharacterized protein E0L32_007033 [Thyridium curvatum]TPX12147.1 hypothetical protein E0L32_007033 [Thyridium curvatum]
MIANMAGPSRGHRKFLIASAITLLLLIYACNSRGLFVGDNPFWDKISRPSSPSKSSSAKDVGESIFPDDYRYVSDDQKDCETFLGASYLTAAAAKQADYCEASSPSKFHCFLAPRRGGEYKSDPTCLAQGVLYDPNPIESHRTLSESDAATPSEAPKPFSLQCTLRNFTNEMLLHPERKDSLADVPPVDKMDVYWFDTGLGQQMKEWEFDGQREQKCNSTDDGWILLVRREGNTNVWHKLMEPWQAMHSLDIMQMARNPATGTPWLSKRDAADVRVVFEDDRQEVYDRWWTMVTGNAPIRRSDLQPGTCFKNVILPMAGSSSPFWSALLETNYHDPCQTRFLLDTFIRRLFRFLNIAPRPAGDIHEDPTITIIDRKKTRRIIDMDSKRQALERAYPRSQINIVDFATITIEDQVRLMQATDVLVGHHGAGITNILYLPPDAAVVEIFPPFFSMRGFRSIARMRGLTHFAAPSIWPEEYNHTVHGTPLPDGWQRPQTDRTWQTDEVVYMTDEDFLGYIDGAVRNQKNKKHD